MDRFIPSLSSRNDAPKMSLPSGSYLRKARAADTASAVPTTVLLESTHRERSMLYGGLGGSGLTPNSTPVLPAISAVEHDGVSEQAQAALSLPSCDSLPRPEPDSTQQAMRLAKLTGLGPSEAAAKASMSPFLQAARKSLILPHTTHTNSSPTQPQPHPTHSSITPSQTGSVQPTTPCPTPLCPTPPHL